MFVTVDKSLNGMLIDKIFSDFEVLKDDISKLPDSIKKEIIKIKIKELKLIMDSIMIDNVEVTINDKT